MKRTLQYTITSKEAGITIRDFLKLQGYSAQCLIELKKIKNSILLNDKWEYVNTCLCEEDKLVIQIEEKTEEFPAITPVCLPFPIVYEDEDMIIVNKPAGMAVHPSMNHYDDTLANAAAYYFGEKGESFTYRCINRLDRDTSGLVILAKHIVSSSILYKQMTERSICREYLAIVEGENISGEGTVDLPIGRKEGSVIERKIDWAHGERAVTHYKVLEKREGISLLSLHLDTGRTHQIRVHMKEIGHPLIGDFLYNPEDNRMSRQALHSYRLSFRHPITGDEIEFIAPLPEDMRMFFDGNYEQKVL